ncbi:MAG: YggT family protein [Alphaproteobacteria bacterium]
MDNLLIIVDPLIRVVITILDIYIWVILISVILSWLVAFDVINTRNRFVYSVGHIVSRLTEPALRPIRRILPNLGGIDLSPLALILGVWFAQKVLANLLNAMIRASL